MATYPDYDTLPYEDCPIAETHPESLAVIGRLFNIDVAPVANCRVLELGCASGGNLIPMAYHWPGSHFVGVELSERQATDAQAICNELALENIQILQANILDIDSSLGRFDYIIVHGVYSWVPKPVQDHILRLCRELLNPSGIAYISYNTYPGWNLREPIRHMMMHHARHATTSEARVRKGVELLGMLARGLSADSSSSMQNLLREEVLQLIDRDLSYLKHEYMEENNIPLYFHQFMERAAAFQLRYIADTDLYTMFGQDQAAGHHAELDDIESLIDYEQYLDFFNIRFFRQSLLCVAELDVEYDVAIDKLQDWHLYASFHSSDMEVDLSTSSPQTFVDRAGRSFVISHPLTKAAAVLLSENYPNGYAFNSLAGLVRELVLEHGDDTLANQADVFLTELFGLYISQGLRLSVEGRDINSTVSEKPTVSHLVRSFSQHEKNCIASIHHHTVEVDAVDRFILDLLTGENTLPSICVALLKRRSDSMEFREQLIKKGFQNLDDNTAVEEHVRQLLNHYAMHGFLEA